MNGGRRKADKRHVKQRIKQIERVKTWQLIILLILSAFLAATFLRINNVGMVQRRDAVLTADKEGNIDDVQSRINELRRYTAAHMNADTGVFYLQEQYNRDVQKALKSSSDLSSERARANEQADRVCKPRFTGWSTAYMECFLNELAKYPTSSTLPAVTLPSPALYRYEFSAPRWSPDFAGFTVLLTLGITVVIVVRLIGLVILRAMLKRRYQEL